MMKIHIENSLFIGAYSRLAIIHGSMIKAVKQKQYKLFMIVELNDNEIALKKLRKLIKKKRKIGGISLLDEQFTKEYLKSTGITVKPTTTHILLLNVLTNSYKSLTQTKLRIRKIAGTLKVQALPEANYDKYLHAFWMLRVFFKIVLPL